MTAKTYPKAFLPNKEGYEFIGILNDGREVVLHIAKNERGIHYIETEYNYEDIKEWKRL